MPEKSGFFDSTATDTRAYPAREFAEYFARFVGNGVFSGGTYLKVAATGADANISIQTGYGWINGYLYGVYDTALTLPIQAATTLDRIDRVILRLDVSAAVRSIKAMVLQGTPSTTPTAPAITRSGDIYDLSLAQVRVNANTSVVLPANVADERLNNNVCGIVTGLIDQANTTTIFNQFQAFLDQKTAEYQLEWQQFLESVQDEGFATTQYVDNRVLTGGYGATTNSGNAYSVTLAPAPTALVAGLRATVRINAANTGAATLNVNGLGAKSILKSNGSALTANSLRAASVYSLVYNGTSFILQGEGGEYGTAIAGDVRSTKTIGTEAGLVTGTLVTRNTSAITVTPETTDQNLAAGIYDYPVTVKGDADLIKANIRNGVDIFGVIGTLLPRQFASGSAVMSSANMDFIYAIPGSNGVKTARYIEVSGLTFKPSLIVIYRNGMVSGLYYESFSSPNGEAAAFMYMGENPSSGVYPTTAYMYPYYMSTTRGNAYINSTGFRLPVLYDTPNSITYIAFG
ncbi:hypothetical protein P4H27_25855 [Paenibacillus taichungensis]|uniref:hypothetical protein n=1 Tax=Paenibacillus taichungensis TaxID=484184 RepID=UPI002DB58849|nr:hypothetical protein [Paenibacillus taichungensis]MEC0110399.1 hypothetical protein [Paenibacillus taichungensis]MEC0200075.1 hypothetical protein [Paenibacillus taichungensis]